MNMNSGQQSLPLKLVKREVQYASSLRHPNIVRLLDVFAEGTQLVLAWELIEGRDLLDLLNDQGGRMPEDMAAFYMHQILRAVSFMHEKAYCHRDLKPENCMVETRTQILKIIDFGLSKHLDSVNTFGVGTPDYMAPEMLNMSDSRDSAERSPKYDATAVDVWSLGVSLYLLVAGFYPFEDPRHPNSVSHTLSNIKRNKIRPFPSEVSSECQTLIRRLLSPSPGDRPPLREIAVNKWLLREAETYAAKINKLDLFIRVSEPKRVRFRDRVVSVQSEKVSNLPGQRKSKWWSGGGSAMRRMSSSLKGFFNRT